MKRMKVLLSVGHYEGNPGAIGVNGLREYDVVREITDKAFQTMMRSSSFNFIDPIFIQNMTLRQKGQKVAEYMPDLIIENHMNWSKLKSRSGIMTIYEKNNSESYLAAKDVQAELVKKLYSKDLGIFDHSVVKKWRKWSSFFIFDRIEQPSDLLKSNVPTILTEIDYISNCCVANMINRGKDWIDVAAGAIAYGALKYCKGKIEALQ